MIFTKTNEMSIRRLSLYYSHLCKLVAVIVIYKNKCKLGFKEEKTCGSYHFMLPTEPLAYRLATTTFFK